eukprot:337338-Rhodomonas_salina.5
MSVPDIALRRLGVSAPAGRIASASQCGGSGTMIPPYQSHESAIIQVCRYAGADGSLTCVATSGSVPCIAAPD